MSQGTIICTDIYGFNPTKMRIREQQHLFAVFIVGSTIILYLVIYPLMIIQL